MPPSRLETTRDSTSLVALERVIETPAFVYDEIAIDGLLDSIEPIKGATTCKVLFSLKAFSFVDALEVMLPRLDGFAVSSLFEARLAREILRGRGTVHITTPGLRPEEIDKIAELCDHVSFNSLGQLRRFGDRVAPFASIGVRVNPQISFVDDDRYDPCRAHSKLGVPMEELTQVMADSGGLLSAVEGIHVHTNCESTDLSQALLTVRHLSEALGPLLANLKWVNLGGGYLFDQAGDAGPLIEAIDMLESKFGLQVYIEPGAALVRGAGYIVSSVLDVFPSEGKQVAVLDTTVNHMPEVLEYGYEPDVAGHVDDGEFEYLLAGSTCLAGDLFGAYTFATPLEIGARLVFTNAGAYTLSKAHTFNGVNLPAVYSMDQSGELALKKKFTYGDYAENWGAGIRVPG